MKIEFSKLPRNRQKFEISSNSVKFIGTFCRITATIAKIDAIIKGNFEVECCKCAKNISQSVDENIVYTLSDGAISLKDEREDEIIIEIDNHIVDFDDILNSELESINSDYYLCDSCSANGQFVDIEI